MINIKEWGIRKRVFFLTFVPLITITTILSIYFISSRIEDVRQSLRERGLAMAKHLAPASEFALLTENQELLQSLVDGVLSEPDVVSVSIHNSSNTISAKSYSSKPKVSLQGGGAGDLSPDLLTFKQPVRVKGFAVFDYADGDTNKRDQDQAVIGLVTVVLSQKTTLMRQQQIIYGGVFIIVAGLLLSILMAHIIGGSVTQPVINLTNMGQELSRSNLSARVAHDSGGEIGELQYAFNNLAATLERSHSHMLEKIDYSTRELRATVAELEVRNKELEQARKDAEKAGKSKADFLAKMSHEIRTPMNAVIGFTRLLLKTRQTDGQHEYTRTIQQSAIQLLTILDDILNYSKLESGTIEMERESFDLQLCLEDVICMLSPAAHEKSIELVLLLHSDIPQRVRGVPIRICQVLTNLVNNAIKFTQKGNVIVQVTLQADSEREALLKVSVKDTGIGVDKNKSRELFSEFVQVDSSITRRFGGTGLGLTIAKRFVELMGGEIGLESTPGKGSDFWFTFPIEKEDALAVEDSNFLQGVTALVVDSHAISRRAIRNNLLRWGASVFVSSDLEKGLRSVYHANPKASLDLLLLGLSQQDFKRLDAMALLELQKAYSFQLILLVGMEQAKPIPVELVHSNIIIMNKPFRRDTLRRHIYQLLHQEYHEAADSPQYGSPEEKNEELSGICVLAAEDNEFNRMLIRALLEAKGAKVSVAVDGNQAMEKAVSTKYDVILMDIHMPETNGIEAAAAIRAGNGINRCTPIIALTADVFTEERDNLSAAGFNDVLLKPIIEEKLFTAVRLHSGKFSSPNNKPGLEAQKLFADQQSQTARLPDYMLNRFREEIPKQINALNQAYAKKDKDLIIHHAHVIHGLAGYFQRPELSESAKALEIAARQEKDDLSYCVTNLNKLYNTLMCAQTLST